MANAAGGDFAMHRRLILEVALEVGDRGGGEDFTAAGGAVGGGEVGGMPAKLAIAAVSVANCCCIGAMTSLTASLITVFNS